MTPEVRKYLSEQGKKGGAAVSPQAAHRRAIRANQVRWGKKRKKKKLRSLPAKDKSLAL